MRHAPGIRFALCAGLLLLGGCKTIESFVAEQTAATYETVPDRFVEVAEQHKLDTPAGRRDATGLNVPAQPDPAERLAGAEPLEAYLREIAGRLVAHYPGPKPGYEIYVTTSSEYTASIDATGALRVPVGLLVNAESEDEVAFVLGHELSHRIMNHSGKEEIERQTDSAAQLLFVGSIMLDGEAGARRGRLNSVGTAILLTQAVNRLALSPAWSRRQEDEADLLSVDLLHDAGYSYQAAYTAFERMADAERRAEADRQEAERALQAHVDALMRQGRISEGLDVAFQRLSQGPVEIVGEFLSQVGATHPKPETRRRDLAFYVDREYGDEALPPPIRRAAYETRVFSGPGLNALRKPILAARARQLLGENRLDDAAAMAASALRGANDPDPELRIALYEIRLAQGDVDRAVENLAIAARGPAAPVEVFSLLIAAEVGRGRPGAALDALEAMERRFPATRTDNLPFRLRLMLAADRTGEARRVFDACQASGDARARAGCEAVMRDRQGSASRRP